MRWSSARRSIDGPRVPGLGGDLGQLRDRLLFVGFVGEAADAVASVRVVAHDPEEDDDRAAAGSGGPRRRRFDRQRLSGDSDPIAGGWGVHSTMVVNVAGVAPCDPMARRVRRCVPGSRTNGLGPWRASPDGPQEHPKGVRTRRWRRKGRRYTPRYAPSRRPVTTRPSPMTNPVATTLPTRASTTPRARGPTRSTGRGCTLPSCARSSRHPILPPREVRPREWAIGIGSAVAAIVATVLVLVAFGALGGRHRSAIPPPVVTNPTDVVDYTVAEQVAAVGRPERRHRPHRGDPHQAVGSGVVIRPDRVITTAHLLSGATRIEWSPTAARRSRPSWWAPIPRPTSRCSTCRAATSRSRHSGRRAR